MKKNVKLKMKSVKFRLFLAEAKSYLIKDFHHSDTR